jgi:glycosyltransferase involved in cell wall biosynthesis
MKKKILIISHDASRTGAPILLLHFLQALKKRNSTLEFDIIIFKEGPLISEFKQFGRVLVLDSLNLKNNLISRIINKIKIALFGINIMKSTYKSKILKFANHHYDSIFSNTITNGNILDIIKPKNVNVITYVHELENAISRFTTPQSLSYAKAYTTHYLVPSFAVQENLIKNHQVQEDKISRLPYYIPEVFVLQEKKNEIKETLLLGECLVIGGMGTCDWRKGTDVFLQVLVQLKRHFKTVKHKFLWIGADKSSLDYKRLIYDATKAGVIDDLLMIDSVENSIDYLSIMDVFLLTSREDPYPLVVLEAAMQKKPIICFEGSGGAVEFIRTAENKVIPYLDTYLMAEKLMILLCNSDKRKLLGERAWKHYNKLHSETATLPILDKIL